METDNATNSTLKYYNDIRNLERKMSFLSETKTLLACFLFQGGSHEFRRVADLIANATNPNNIALTKILQKVKIEAEGQQCIDQFKNTQIVYELQERYETKLDSLGSCPIIEVFQLLDFYMEVARYVAQSMNELSGRGRPIWRLPSKFGQQIIKHTALVITTRYMENIFRYKKWTEIEYQDLFESVDQKMEMK